MPMFDDLPNQIPPIVGLHPFTGVPVVLGTQEMLDDVVEEESSEEVIQEQEQPAKRMLADVLPDEMPEFAGDGNPFTGLGVALSIPEPAVHDSESPTQSEQEAYDERGLPNIPPPVQNNRGIHTKIPSLKEIAIVVPDDQQGDVPEDPEPQEEAKPEVDIPRLRELFFAYFPEDTPSWRRVGTISEYPLVRNNGHAADLAELWPSLRSLGFHEHREPNGMLSGLVGPDYAIRCGTGRGVVAIHIPTQHDLHTLHEVRTQALDQLASIAETRKLALLGCGIHPVAKPSPDQLNHIFHVFSLFSSIGEEWGLYGVRAQEYTQLSCGQNEFLDQLLLGHILEPVCLALFGNSAVWGGEDQHRCAGAQHLQDQFPLEEGRCGMFVTAPKSVEEYCRTLSDRKSLLLRDHEGWKNSCTEMFSSLLAQHDWEPLLYDHMDCDWGPVRPILDNGLLQWRAEQQPQDAQLSLAALSLGIMDRMDEWKDFLESFCAEPPEPMMFGIRMEELHRIRMERVRDPWNDFVAWRRKAIDYGLERGEVFTGLIEGVLQIAQNGLEARGLNEEVYLAPLWKRWNRKRNPAQEIRSIFARRGVKGLIEALRMKGS